MNTPLFPAVAFAVIASTATLAIAQQPAPVQPPLSPPAADDFTPMTRSERLACYVKQTFGPVPFAETAAWAEVEQLRHFPSEWGRTPAGLGARVGSGLAHHVVRGTLQYTASALLHEDNRYRRSADSGFWRRLGHAVVSSFLARRDNGRRGFGFSRIGSAAGASFIARAWLPRSIATVGSAAGSFGVTIGADVGINVLHEFWPDIRRHLRRR